MSSVGETVQYCSHLDKGEELTRPEEAAKAARLLAKDHGQRTVSA